MCTENVARPWGYLILCFPIAVDVLIIITQRPELALRETMTNTT